jgi:hypothetical protein
MGWEFWLLLFGFLVASVILVKIGEWLYPSADKEQE